MPLPKEVHLSNENFNHHHHQHHQQHNLKNHNSYQPEDDVDIDEIQIIESDMERFHLSKKDSSLNGSQISNASHNGSTSNKKWSFGRLFRRKKEVETDSSSEEDRKAGFLPSQKYNRSANSSVSAAITSTPNKKSKSSKSSASSRGSKLMSENFDHVIVPPTAVKSFQNFSSSSQHHVDNEFFLPVETVPAPEPYYQNKPVQQPQQRLHHSQQYLPHVPQTQQQLMSRSAHSLDRRTAKAKQRSLQKMSANGLPSTTLVGSSSEEEIISLNSTTFAKYRSDESIHSGGQSHVGGQSRRSRAARNERYYKRLSRDGEVSHGQVPVMYAQQPTQRWKTQPVPLSIYQAPKQQLPAPQQPQSQMRGSGSSQNTQYSKLRNTNSLQHMAPYVQWGQMQQQQQPKNLQNSVNDTKRSISYDSHIHLQNANGRLQNKPMPPPPPPRDPLRRVNVSGHMQEDGSGDLRPMSYAFDQTGVPVLPTTGLNGRCVSDDKIWAQQPHYQSIHSLNITPNQTSQSATAQPNRRFITRAERDAQPGKKSLPNGLEFHYVADATPRSRKPIHLLEPNTFENDLQEPPSSGILRTTKSGLPNSPTKVNATEFWKRLEGSSQNINTPTPAPRGRDAQRANVSDKFIKPRSISSSRVGEMRAYPVPMYSEVYKPKTKISAPSISTVGGDEVDSVICGSLHIKPAQDKSNNYVEIRNKDENSKSKSMPNNYQRRSGELPTTPNKYEEYVNERREQHHNPLFDLPQPPQRKLSGVPQIPQLSFSRKKPANLEEAINELEAIYRSLGLTEESETKKERVPTPNDFEKYAVAHADEYDDEDSPTGEPDPVKDDVAFRNIKLANLQHKTVEKQPPFGIPVGPIVPAAQTDYLHVTPKRKDSAMYDLKSPDVVKDDLAVRALRKDPGESRDKFQYPSGSLLKKNRATRTQSANIYALIQRDAAKPSGGDLHSYLELTKSIDRSGSMSDLYKHDSASDIPTTLKLLQNLREQEREQNQNQVKKVHIPFRHPSQGGAICQLPEKLSSACHEEENRVKPVPMPRKSLTPEPRNTDTHKMEEALNKIAQDAQESSIKLSQELKELRKEALITASKPKKACNEEEQLEKELQEIEKVSQAAKQCGQLLLDTLPDVSMEEGETNVKKRKLHKEDKLIKAIDQVSEAANKVCEKILKDIVTTEPPVVVQEAVKVTQKPISVSEAKDDNLVMPTLIKKLDPIQSTNIESIARRCMRQLSDLADNHDYDNLNQPDIAVASTCNIQQVTKDETTNDLNTSHLTETRKPPNKPMTKNNQHSKQIEEIDQIMKECEDQAKQSQIANTTVKGNPVVVTQHVMNAPGSSTNTTASSFSSSSDCLAKSSSPSGGSRPFSSSITSFNPYSSSDYIKSPSSEFHAPSTDPIKTFSTTSYDVQSTTSATPNQTTVSTFSYSPSPPPLNLTPVSNCSATIASYTQRGRSTSPSQYNSSEELAMIFGIEEKTRTRQKQKQHNNSGKDDATPELLLLEQEKLKLNAASPTQCTANSTTTTTITTTEPCECCCAKTNDYPLYLTPNSCSQTNTASSSPISLSTSSSSSLRLEAIPETGLKVNQKSSLVKPTTEKSEELSPHFSRVYASKFKIIVDKIKEDTNQHTMIKCNSLSSLEDTSSNPDSGNVSLADFPLGQQHINNSVHLNSNFNSRYEIRNCFKTEISIDTLQEENKKVEKVTVKEEGEGEGKGTVEEFPRLPTAEEIENSLKEDSRLEQAFKRTEQFLGEHNILKERLALTKEDHELIGERIIWARDEIMAEVKALEKKALMENHQQEILKGNAITREIFNEQVALDECFKVEPNDSENESPKRKRSIVIETPLLEMNIMEEKINYAFNVEDKSSANVAKEVLQLQKLVQNCEDLSQVLNEEIQTESHTEKKIYQNFDTNSQYEYKDEEKYNNHKDGEKEIRDEVLNQALKQEGIAKDFKDARVNNMNHVRDSVELDQDLSLDLNRGFQIKSKDFQSAEMFKEIGDLDLKQEQASAERNQNLNQSLNAKLENVTPEQSINNTMDNELRLRVWQPPTTATNQRNDMPSTSSKALANNMVVNIMGEQRPAVNSLTLLEHLVVACTLGVISTDDLFTLCLIIIGIIIVIAIALF